VKIWSGIRTVMPWLPRGWPQAMRELPDAELTADVRTLLPGPG